MTQAHRLLVADEPAGAPAGRRLGRAWLGWLGPLFWGSLLPAGLLLLWTIGLRQGWISPHTLPDPTATFETGVDLIRSGELFTQLAISLGRVLVGFLIGALCGLVLGGLMGLSRTIEDYLFPSFKFISYIPMMAWVPILLMLVGIGEGLKFLLIAKSTLIPVALNTCRGLQNVSESHRELARVYKLNAWQTFWRVLAPGAVAPVWSGLRYGLSYAWLVLVVVEMLASSEGIGFLMTNAQQLFQLEVVIVGMVTVGVVGLLIDQGLAAIERHLLRWRRGAFQ